MFQQRKSRILQCIMLVGLLMLSSLTFSGKSHYALAQEKTSKPVDNTPQGIINDLKNHGFEVKLRNENGVNVFIAESVSPYVLTQLANQQLEITGIISGFSNIKQRYVFATDDRSRAVVNGDFASNTSGTRWTLRARVAEDVAQILANNKNLEVSAQKPVLYEITKCQGVVAACGSDIQQTDALSWIRDNPLIAVGIVIILLALIALFVVMERNKKAELERQRLEAERLRREEQAKQDQRRREEEERRRIELEHSHRGQNGETVVSNSGVNSYVDSGKTLISIGSLKAESGPFAGISFPLTAGETRIGRQANKGNQIVLDKDQEVSGYHGSVIVTHDGRIIYRDASSNGSYVNDQFVQYSQVDVESGSKINIGGSTFTVITRRPAASIPSNTPSVNTPSAAPAAISVEARRSPTVQIKANGNAFSDNVVATAAPTSVSFGAELEVIDGPLKGQRFPISKGVTTFGREGRDILFSEDGSISRKHATLTLRDGKFILADDGSTHGTKVNGNPINPNGQQLANGDEISLGAGNTKLVFRSIY